VSYDMGTDTIFTCQGKNKMVSVPIFLSTIDLRAFAVRLTDFEAIEDVIIPIRIRGRDKGALSIQHIDINRIMVIGRREAMASYTDGKNEFLHLMRINLIIVR
jgi:hypothetical protein